MPTVVNMRLSLKHVPKPQVQAPQNLANVRRNMSNLYANLGAINNPRGGCSSCGR